MTNIFFYYYYYYLVVGFKKKKVLLTTLRQAVFTMGGRKTNGKKKESRIAYQDVVLDRRSYIFNLLSGNAQLLLGWTSVSMFVDSLCERL